jgi:hypothetical protein
MPMELTGAFMSAGLHSVYASGGFNSIGLSKPQTRHLECLKGRNLGVLPATHIGDISVERQLGAPERRLKIQDFPVTELFTPKAGMRKLSP